MSFPFKYKTTNALTVNRLPLNPTTKSMCAWTDFYQVIGDEISCERLNVVKDNEYKIDMINNDRIKEREITLQAQHGLKLQEQQQCQGSTICWQQFLHVTSIKVLVVENDDSIRHVVFALLQNSNYDG
ncbi:hypothetical protein HAX54_052141 [Datura stramonium]|uniref:Response regulatory domain-containing protein n=1 Tax=Datura stramonium TaxID=4076 RepID=A0ABS8RRN2_DATST|nr:hypothetical protein [Datura stramonium]